MRLCLLITILVLTIASGCATTNAPKTITPTLDHIDQIQVVLAMGNPAYGADSKTITDPQEIAALIHALNHATIGTRVAPAEAAVSDTSKYFFHRNATLIHQVHFNGNDTTRIWHNSDWHYISYPDRTPYEQYKASTAPVIVVDEDLNEIKRPEQ